ncbi:MAG: hypothetical protein ACFBWO_12190 [Paracoccaceae bacterium]
MAVGGVERMAEPAREPIGRCRRANLASVWHHAVEARIDPDDTADP